MKGIAIVLCVALLLSGCTSAGEPSSSSQPQSSSQESSQSLQVQPEDLESPKKELPSMTQEQETYSKTYLEPLCYSGFFWREYTGDPQQLGKQVDEQGNTIGGDLLFMLWEDLTPREERDAMYEEYPDGNYPQELVEQPLIDHFGFTSQQIRTQLSNVYDAQTGTYFYQGGRGGGPVFPIVTGSSMEGDLLTLTYEVYSLGGGLDYDEYLCNVQGELTIRLDGDNFVYESNHLTWKRA